MDISARASRPSSLRSQDTWEPSPTTTPRATISAMPPSVSPASLAASMRLTICSLACSSRQRTGDWSEAAFRGVGSGEWFVVSTPPSATTWLPISTPNSASRRRHTAPAATRAAVSRAEARSRTSRASPRSYLREPARSAWPGRGRASLRRGSSSRAPGLITSSQLAQSRFSMSSAMGEPSVTPARTPERICASSASIFMRAPRP